MDLPLRCATPEDLDAVMDLERAGFPAGIVEERAVFAQRIAAFPEGFLLAGDPAWGYLCAETWSGWDLSDTRRFELGHDLGSYLARGGDTLYVASMTVAPEARGRGLGRSLFRAGLSRLLADFQRTTQAVLIVNEGWSAARRIYAAEGFAECGRLSAFFRPQGASAADALVLRKAVRPA